MDTYNSRKALEITDRLLVRADEIILMLETLEKSARELKRIASTAK